MKRLARTIAIISLLLAFSIRICAGQQTTDWPVYNGGANGDHYSRLTQIDRGNVQRLKVAWSFDTGEKGGVQSNPLIVGRVLYGYTPTQKVVALDAATGQLLWKFDSGIPGTQPARGVAYWSDGTDHRILAGVMNFLYCLNADTGKPIESFGESGRIDLRKGLDRGLGGNFEEQSIALTTPGIIYKDLIIVGGRNPETHPAPPGDVRAFDVRNGKLRWSFHSIPRPGEAGYETWPPEAWKMAGAANNWAGMALDVERGIVYAPTGSAVFDFYGGDRVGDDLYANTILALDAETGKRLWSFQGVHHDIWDRDFPSPPALVTLQHDGKNVEALAQTTKQGYLYLFDRLTGMPLFPIHEHPYPASTIPGEVTSPTQPAPDAPEPFARQRLTEDMLTNRTPEAHAWAVKEFRTFRSDGQFLPFALDQQTVIFPGFDGGAEWGGPAVDPTQSILYVNATEMAWTGGLTVAAHGGTVGSQLYQNQCAMCHGVNRAGAPPAFPSLVDVDKRLTADKITDAIRQGKGRMPSFPNIDQTRLAALLDYLRTGASTAASSDAAKELGGVPTMRGVPAMAEARRPQTNRAGAAAYYYRCAACHGNHMEGVPPALPMLIGLGSRMTAAQTIEIIHKGRGRMPAISDVQGGELKALLKYLGVEINPKPPTVLPEGRHEGYTFTGYRKFLDPDGYPAIAPPWGTLNAIDLKSGKYLWKISLGEYPDLVRQGMTNTGSESYGGPIVTAGGLVFIGATVYDRKFRAFDSGTGKLLWETELPFAGVATPSTYMIDGRQYVVIAASGGRDPKGPVGGAYVAFALGP